MALIGNKLIGNVVEKVENPKIKPDKVLKKKNFNYKNIKLL